MKSNVATILRVTSGNFLEMFDFFLFGFYAADIARAFFPAASEVASLLLAFATFGAGFLMRPLGAVILGAYVDRVGRRKGLIVTLAIMAAGTLMIAVTPGHESFGLAAAILVVAGRLLQGFSAGVELGGVSVYLAEMAPPGRKGFFVSWQSGSQQVAIMLAAVLGYGLKAAIDPVAMRDWGWRIPFAIGSLIVPLLFHLRRSLEETPEFLRQLHPPKAREAAASLLRDWRIVLSGMLLVVMTTVSFYAITVYTPTYGSRVLNLSAEDSLIVTFCIGLSNLFWLPVMGALSDRVGRRTILLVFTSLAIVSVYPALRWLVEAPSFTKMLLVELWLSWLYASYNGAMVVALTEWVPARLRTAGFSLAYSLATALFGGFTPAISTALIATTADKAAPGLWMSFAAVCGLAATLYVYRGKAFHDQHGRALAPSISATDLRGEPGRDGDRIL